MAPFWLVPVFYVNADTAYFRTYSLSEIGPQQRNAQEKRQKLEPPPTIDDQRTLRCSSGEQTRFQNELGVSETALESTETHVIMNAEVL